MSSEGDFHACRHCGGLHAWSARCAGQRLMCACGKLITVPDAPQQVDPAKIAEYRDGAAAVPTSTEEIAKLPVAQAHVPSPSEGKRVLRYQPQELDVPDWRESIRGSEFRHLILPLLFIVLAIAIRFGMVLLAGSSGTGHTMLSLGLVLATMALNVITLFVGVGAVATFMGSELGALPVTLIKLTAVAMLDSVILGFGAQLEMHGTMGGYLAVHAVALVNFMLFPLFFELDLQESLFAVAVVGLLQAATMCILWQP